MKHTKKRAVLSAVAMLIVSAIALSSATYAWFSAGTAVGVDQITANVSNTDGSILISATGAAETWKTQISLAELQGVGTNKMNPTLVPVSAVLADESFIGGSINETVFKATGAASTGYMMYKVYIKATADTNVNITPVFSSSVAFVYGGVIQGSNFAILNANAGRSYRPITNGLLEVVDTNTNDIIDVSEANPSDFGPLQSAIQTTTNIPLSMTEDIIYTITVYIWAEGQDAACRGVMTGESANLTLDVVKV